MTMKIVVSHRWWGCLSPCLGTWGMLVGYTLQEGSLQEIWRGHRVHVVAVSKFWAQRPDPPASELRMYFSVKA